MGLPSSEPSPEALTEAIDLYSEIGMPKHLEMAEEAARPGVANAAGPGS